ncbi:MAG: hypothetical protein CMF63_07400 [Magnetovibrio sp.]|nr:hypothetical protein [Magnetovibrio sp.]
MGVMYRIVRGLLFHGFAALIAGIIGVAAVFPVGAEKPVDIIRARQQTQEIWRQRIQSFLDRGVIPLIDLQSSLKREDGELYLDDALRVMDEVGLALIAFDGYQASKGGKGYRWGYYVHEIVNAHPDRIVLATNGGTNPNWLGQKGGQPRHFVDQLEKQVRGGDYPIIGELDFRHYMSNRQCKKGRTDRDSDIPLNGENGSRVFRLAEATGVPIAIHLEPEDAPLDALQEMLASHPKAPVIVAHFGQIRHPARQKRFGPDLARQLLTINPNLYYDLSTGDPGRQYHCGGVFDTVIWEDGSFGQTDNLKPEYKAILNEFSDRFVVGTDYGGGRGPLPAFLKKKVANIRLILRDLAGEAKHDIGYRNAWKLLTGKNWGAAGRGGR